MIKTALLLLAITMISHCQKGRNDSSAEKSNLVNKWEMRKSVGGFAGTVTYQPGNGRIIEFKSDHSFVRYANGSLVESGTYKLQSDTANNQYKVTFHMNGTDQLQHIILKGDTLVLLRIAPCCDIPDDTYVIIN